MIKKIVPFIFLVSCMDIIIDNSTGYKSIHLMGGSWIEVPYENVSMDDNTETDSQFSDYLSVLNDNFTIQIILSGDSIDTNEQLSILSLVNTDGDILFSINREPDKDNSIAIYKDNERVGSYESPSLDWSSCSTFYMLSIVQDTDTGEISVYIDDSKIADDIEVIDNSDKCSISIGAISNSEHSVLQNFWCGYIDEFRIWNTNLSSDEITFHSNNRSKISESSSSSYMSNLYGMWDCNLTGTNFNDELGTSIYSIDGNVELSENGTN